MFSIQTTKQVICLNELVIGKTAFNLSTNAHKLVHKFTQISPQKRTNQSTNSHKTLFNKLKDMNTKG